MLTKFTQSNGASRFRALYHSADLYRAHAGARLASSLASMTDIRASAQEHTAQCDPHHSCIVTSVRVWVGASVTTTVANFLPIALRMPERPKATFIGMGFRIEVSLQCPPAQTVFAPNCTHEMHALAIGAGRHEARDNRIRSAILGRENDNASEGRAALAARPTVFCPSANAIRHSRSIPPRSTRVAFNPSSVGLLVAGSDQRGFLRAHKAAAWAGKSPSWSPSSQLAQGFSMWSIRPLPLEALR
jgi:hypothetical protein